MYRMYVLIVVDDGLWEYVCGNGKFMFILVIMKLGRIFLDDLNYELCNYEWCLLYVK